MIYPGLNGWTHAVFIPSFLTNRFERQTELGNKLGDLDAGVSTLQAADQGKWTILTLHDKVRQSTNNTLSIKGREALLWENEIISYFIHQCIEQTWKPDWRLLMPMQRRKEPWWHNYKWKSEVQTHIQITKSLQSVLLCKSMFSQIETSIPFSLYVFSSTYTIISSKGLVHIWF